MTRKEAIKRGKVMIAWGDGEVVEVKNMNGKWSQLGSDPGFYANDTYRIRPTPVTRPWNRGNCPIGEVVVGKSAGNPRVITEALMDGCCLGADDDQIEYADILEHYVMKEDDSPCGITE